MMNNTGIDVKIVQIPTGEEQIESQELTPEMARRKPMPYCFHTLALKGTFIITVQVRGPS